MDHGMSTGRMTRVAILGIGLSAIDTARKIVEGSGLSASEALFSVLGNLILAYYLLWLQGATRLRRRDNALLLWLNLFVVGAFSNMLEGYFFTDVFDSAYALIAGSAVMIVITGLQGVYASFTLPEGEKRLRDSLDSYLATRGGSGWTIRVLAGAVGYFPIYFFFGMLVSPFVMPYYRDPSLGLIVPPFTVIVPLEVFRGLMYVACLLPIVAALGSGRRTTVTALTGMLFIPGALLPLLADQGLPAPIIPFHLVEIFADSAVYGYVLARLLEAKNGA